MKNLKAKTQKGFSLVELMIVIAIIAILAAVAIPMYSDYTTRTKISSEIAKLGGVKADVAEQIADSNVAVGGTITGINGTANTPANAAVGTDGAITLNVGNATIDDAAALSTPIVSDTAAVTLTPQVVSSGAVIWTCGQTSGSTSLSNSELPSECR